MNLLLSIKHGKTYSYWKQKSKGKKFCDYRRGCGYYLTVGLLGHNPKGTIWKTVMSSGKTGIFECINYKTFSDPWDMIEHSDWNLIGYDGVKPIANCSFEEFLELYPNLIKK